MNIVYSCPLDPLAQSAAGSHVLGVVRAWARQGHRVTLIHPGPRIGISDAGEVAFPSAGGRPAVEARLGRHVRDALHSSGADLLFHRFSKSSFLPLVAARLAGAPVVLEVNVDVHSEGEEWGDGSVRRKAIRWVEKLNYRAADHIVAVSDGVAYALRSSQCASPEAISVVPNGTDLEVYRPRDRGECCRLLDLSPGRRHIVFAGSFQPRQGLPTLVEAAHRLSPRDNLAFHVVGDGPLRTILESRVAELGMADCVSTPGWQSPERTALYLGASDVCVAPYGPEAVVSGDDPARYGAMMIGSPLKVVTYLAAGRPVVATHFAEAGALVETVGAGIAVPPHDAAALAAAIGRLLRDPKARARMGHCGREAALDGRGWDSVAMRLADVCSAVVQARGGGSWTGTT